MNKNKFKLLSKVWPFFFVFFVWFIFSSPYFLKGLVPYPSTYQVNHYPPWSSYSEFLGPVKNGAMPDIIDQMYPWKHFTIETYKKGQIPLWNPNSFAGNPHLANFQTAVFSPLNVLFFIFPFIDAWSVAVLLQPLLAGIFMYLFVRSLERSKFASLISAITFMFCGFLVVWMAYGTLSLAIAFLPLALFGAAQFIKTKKIKYLIIFSLSIPASFFSGHFQISFYFLFFVATFILFQYISAQQSKQILLLLIVFGFGLLLSLPQLIPSIQFYTYSVRSGLFNTGGGIPIQYLVTSFAPDLFGNPVTRNDWFGYYAEWASFVGILSLLLASFSTYLRKDKKNVIYFLFMALLTILLAIDSPLQKLITALKIPVLSTSIPSRIIVLFSFSIAVLSGFGLDEVIELITKRSHRKIIKIITIFIALFILIWALIFVLMPFDKVTIAKRNLVFPTAVFFVASAIILLGSLLKIKKTGQVVVLLLLLLASFDSLRFAQKWMPFDPKKLVFIDLPVLTALQKNIENGRVFGNLGNQVYSYYNISSIEGYDPLYIERFGEFAQSSNTGSFTVPERSVVKLSRNGKYLDRVLDLLGVRIIFHPVADTNQGWAYPVWKDTKRFSLIYSDGRFQLFKNNQAMGRTALFYKYNVLANSKALLNKFYTPDFDFRHVLLLEEDPHLEKSSAQAASKNPTIVSYTPNKVTIHVETNKSALLFLSDNFYPGWKAFVNGKETKIYRADYTFRAVVVPKGNSTVEFEYRII